MAQRVGTCASCGAQFRVPASFQADRVKCKQCGGGVELAPAGAPSAQPSAPAPKAAPSAPKPVAPPPQVAAPLERGRPTPKPAADPVSAERSASLRAAAQEAAERIRAAGPVTNTAADRLRETALRPRRTSRAPLLAGVGIAIALAAGAAWTFWGSGGEAPVQAANSHEPSALSGDQEPLPELAKLPGTSDSDWTQIQAWTASAVGPAVGADADAARAHLLERGREAFPALLAALERLDLTTESGAAAGERAHRILAEIAKGKSLEWQAGASVEAANANAATTRAWHAAWLAARETPQAWAELTHTDLATAQALFERTGPQPR